MGVMMTMSRRTVGSQYLIPALTCFLWFEAEREDETWADSWILWWQPRLLLWARTPDGRVLLKTSVCQWTWLCQKVIKETYYGKKKWKNKTFLCFSCWFWISEVLPDHKLRLGNLAKQRCLLRATGTTWDPTPRHGLLSLLPSGWRCCSGAPWELLPTAIRLLNICKNLRL